MYCFKMLSPLENEVIEGSAKAFEENLHNASPLRHMSEYNDEVTIRDVADKEARKCRLSFIQKLNDTSEIGMDRTGVLLDTFCSRLQKLVDDYVIVHNESRTRSVSFLEQRVHLICEDIQQALEVKPILNPDMDIQSVESLCKNEMDLAMSYFQIWKHGNIGTFEEHKRKLEQKLRGLQVELLEKHRRHLDPNSEAKAKKPQGVVQSCALFFEGDNGIASLDCEHLHEPGAENIISVSLHTPDDRGYVPWLRAISDGHSSSHIQEMLDKGANPNVTTMDGHGLTAAHVVILSLIEKKMQPVRALSILNLLITKGFNLINAKTISGLSALSLAMEYHELNDDIILWFNVNGADFNAVDNEFGSSVLFHAVFCHQPVRLLRMLVNCGANPTITNRFGDSIQHISSFVGHDAALEYFLDQRYLNELNKENETCLSLMFAQKDFDYERSLVVLLKNGVDFRCRCRNGCHNVIKHWLFHGEVNPFPALWKTKGLLPITEELASEILTFFIQEIQLLQKFVLAYPRREIEDCVHFLLFIMESRNGKLLFPKEVKLEDQSRRDIEKVILTREFQLKLKRTRLIPWKRGNISLLTATASNCEFLTDDGVVSYSTVNILSCQLACNNYKQFVSFGLAIAKEASKYPVNPVEKKSAKPACLIQ